MDSDSSTSSHVRRSSIKNRVSINSIKEEPVSNSDAENTLPPTSKIALSDRRSLEERIKMLDEMMDKQQKHKLDNVVPTKITTPVISSSLAALASPAAVPKPKLSKIFDLDEQRLHSASLISNVTSLNADSPNTFAPKPSLLNKSSILSDTYLTAACQLAMVVANNKSLITSPSATKDKFASSPLFNNSTSMLLNTPNVKNSPSAESPITPTQQKPVKSISPSIDNNKPEKEIISSISVSTPTSVQIAEKLGLKIKGCSSNLINRQIFDSTDSPPSSSAVPSSSSGSSSANYNHTLPITVATATNNTSPSVKSILKHTPPSKSLESSPSVFESAASKFNSCSPMIKVRTQFLIF